MDERYDPEALRLARQATAAGEPVLWAGRPGRWLWVRWPVLVPIASLATILGMLAWSLRDEWERVTARPEMTATVLVTLVLMKGLTLIPGVLAVRRERREVYAVTSRRVLILGPDAAVRHAVGLGAAGEFKVQGRTLWLGGLDEAVEAGKRDFDGGLRRMEALPRLRALNDPVRVMTVIRTAAGI